MSAPADAALLTVAEAARKLRVSRSTVWRWIDDGKLPAIRAGERAIRIRREDLDALITPARGRKIAAEAGIWVHYDPARVRAALRNGAGVLAGVDRDALLDELRSARGQDSEGRPA